MKRSRFASINNLRVGVPVAVFAFVVGGVARAEDMPPPTCVPTQPSAAPASPPLSSNGGKVVCVPNPERQPVAGHEEPKVVECPMASVHFETDSSLLNDGAKTILKTSAECLKKSPEAKVFVEGAADQRGSREYNLGLGKRRADAVTMFLESEGVAKDQIRPFTVGKDKPLCTDETQSCWAENRRASIASARGGAGSEAIPEAAPQAPLETPPPAAPQQEAP